MKKSLLSLLWIGLALTFDGCSKSSLNIHDIKVPAIHMPSLTRLKVDRSMQTVKNLRARASMSEVVLEWDRVNSNQIAGYRILKYNPKNKTYTAIDSVNDPVATHYVDTKLKYNTAYTYRVSCFTKDGRVSVASAPKTVKTIYNLKPITGTSAISNLPKKIKITWKLYPDHQKIAYYSVQRSDNGTTDWKELTKLRDELSVESIDYTPKSGKTYSYRVIGYTHDKVPTPVLDVVQAHSKPLPKAPINVTATQNEPRKIKLAWFDINDKNKIVKYNIYTSLFKDTLFTKHAATLNKYFVDKVTGDGKVVYYKISAVDEDGLESPLPKKATKAMSKANSFAPKITEYKIVDNTVIITWLPPARDVRRYTVVKKYFNKYFFPKTLKITGFTTRQFVDKDIKLGKTYKYQVIGIDGDGVETKPSREISITIK